MNTIKCYCNKPVFMYTNISKNCIIYKCYVCKYNIEEIIKKNKQKEKKEKRKNMLTSKLYWTKNTLKTCTFLKTISF